MQQAFEQLRLASKQLLNARNADRGKQASRLNIEAGDAGLHVYLLINDDVPEDQFEEVYRLLGSPQISPWLASVHLEAYRRNESGEVEWRLEPLAHAREPFVRLKVFRAETNGASDGYGFRSDLRGHDGSRSNVATLLLERMPNLRDLTLPAPPGDFSFVLGKPHPLSQLTVFDVEGNPLLLRLAESRKFPRLERVEFLDSQIAPSPESLDVTHCIKFLQSAYFPQLRSVKWGRTDLNRETIPLLRGTRVGRQLCRLSVNPRPTSSDDFLRFHALLSRMPFRMPVFDKQPWLTDTVKAIARGIHDSGNLEAILILADALEEAGCTDPHILGHCRDSSPHVPGCWIVESILDARQPRPE